MRLLQPRLDIRIHEFEDHGVGFEGLLSYINDQLPRNEEVGRALQREVRIFPEIAVRELDGNRQGWGAAES